MAGNSVLGMINTGAAVIDVRTPDEFTDVHYQGARNIPVNLLQSRLAEVGAGDKPVVVYCASDARSAMAARAVRMMEAVSLCACPLARSSRRAGERDFFRAFLSLFKSRRLAEIYSRSKTAMPKFQTMRRLHTKASSRGARRDIRPTR